MYAARFWPGRNEKTPLPNATTPLQFALLVVSRWHCMQMSIWRSGGSRAGFTMLARTLSKEPDRARDRKSTRLNSSHGYISYAVFCLKKKRRPAKAGAGHVAD